MSELTFYEQGFDDGFDGEYNPDWRTPGTHPYREYHRGFAAGTELRESFNGAMQKLTGVAPTRMAEGGG